VNGGVSMSKATGEQCTFGCYSGIKHAEPHGELLLAYYCIGIEPLQNQSGSLCVLDLLSGTQEIVEAAFTDHLKHAAVLLLQQLVNHLIRKTRVTDLFGVRRAVFANAVTTNKDHGLQQKIGGSSFALNVINGVANFYVCIEPENHSGI